MPMALNFRKIFTRVDGFIVQELYVHYILCLSSSKRGAVKEPVGSKLYIEDILYAHQADPNKGCRTIDSESTKEISAAQQSHLTALTFPVEQLSYFRIKT